MIDSLHTLKEAGALDALDLAFGEWIAKRNTETAGFLGALVSAEVAKGHVCLDLGTVESALETHDVTPPEDWRTELAQSKAIAKPGERAPLVLYGDRLYLHRYWTYETRIADALRSLAAPLPGIAPELIKHGLNQLFPDIGNGELDRQALAATIGATRRLTILTGGPGTGKTWTVLRLIALALLLDP
ncbi:MAG TPA: exodeoxyribonuclease V subunit alpha, partial [Gammaproteobacteria bacterium]|nr:exodeoxyribonuclease V subunit alpha [Gammaproteobacteria bacterium]